MSFFFFFYFLNLYNSFILKNYVNNRINKIYMGCDYYIDKNLYIYDKSDTVLSYINLEKQKCYFWDMMMMMMMIVTIKIIIIIKCKKIYHSISIKTKNETNYNI